MTSPRYTVTERYGWSYIEGEPMPRDYGPWRYRWEAQEIADALNKTAASEQPPEHSTEK